MEYIFMIDKLTSQLAFMGFLLVIAKMITKRLSPGKADAMFMKLHKPVAYLMTFAGIIHMICSFRVFSAYSMWVYIFGTISVISIVLAIYMFRLNKRNPEKWLIWHRMFSAIAVITIVLHLALR